MTFDLERVAYCKVHPGIGIARVGNSPAEHFLGPEAPGTVQPPGFYYKDAQGRVKRQGARFRVYAYADDHSVLGELTSDLAAITWQVELANTKADWFVFKSRFEKSPERRNPKVPASKRSQLRITPHARSIGAGDDPVELEDGRFFGVRVSLGTLRTDAAGRLVVLGGYGFSSAPHGDPIVDSFNSSGWHDDISDGPVTATVTLREGAREIACTPARVIVGPPDFAPPIENIVTAYDIMRDVALEHGLYDPVRNVALAHEMMAGCDFGRDILPFFERVCGAMWVSDIAARGHGSAYAGDFLERLKQLDDNSPKARPLRQAIFERIRNPLIEPTVEQANPFYMPQLFGDYAAPYSDANWTPFGDPRAWLSVTRTQYRLLKDWADGKFTSGPALVPQPLEALDVALQPAALDRAGLQTCAGGGFHPGMEMTYVIRDHPDLYREPFRFVDLPAGDITKWMACPWQTDFYNCDDQWWPAIRPEQVVTEAMYEEALAQYQAGPERKDVRFAAMLGRARSGCAARKRSTKPWSSRRRRTTPTQAWTTCASRRRASSTRGAGWGSWCAAASPAAPTRSSSKRNARRSRRSICARASSG